MKTIFARCSCVVLVIAAFCSLAIAAPPTGEETAIRQVLMSTWHKPESPLHVDPVVIEFGFALAGWTQGNRGGRALLARRPDGTWSVRVCGGDSLLQAESLEQSAVPAAAAKALAVAARQAEATLPDAQRKLFSTFGDRR